MPKACCSRLGAARREPMKTAATFPWIAGLFLLSAAAPDASVAQSGAVFRCPGKADGADEFTNLISVEQARDRGCRTIEGAPVTVIQGGRTRPMAASAPASSTPRPVESRVDAAAQRQRDTDARRILETELSREEEKLTALRRDYNNGEPERRGNERNYQTYLDRVAQLKAAIGRSEADIAALKREIAKISP